MMTYTIESLVKNICNSFISEHRLAEEVIHQLRKVDPESFMKYIRYHKIILVVSKVLSRSEVPKDLPILPSINIRSKKLVLKNLRMKADSETLIKAFQDDGVVIKPYKGVAFSEIFYNNLSIRYSNDIDYAIQFDDLVKCQSIMRSLGYKEMKGPLYVKNFRRSRAYFLDYPWVKQDGNFINQVDFHINPAHNALSIPCDFNWSGKDPARSFSKVEHALFIIIHHGAMDLWGKLMQLIDLHTIMKSLSTEQITELVENCRAYRVENFLNLGIDLLERIFGEKYEPMSSKIKSNKLIDRIEKDIFSNKLGGKWSENRSKMRYHLMLRNSNMDRFKTISSILKYYLILRS